MDRPYGLIAIRVGAALEGETVAMIDRMPAFHQWLPYLLIPVAVGLPWNLSSRARRG